MDDIWRGRHCSSSFRFRVIISWHSKGELYALNLGYFCSTSTWKHVLDFSLAKVTLKWIYICFFSGIFNRIVLYQQTRVAYYWSCMLRILLHFCSFIWHSRYTLACRESSVWSVSTPYFPFLLYVSSFLSLQDRMLSSILWTMLPYKPYFVFPKHSLWLVHPFAIWVITVYLNWSKKWNWLVLWFGLIGAGWFEEEMGNSSEDFLFSAA